MPIKHYLDICKPQTNSKSLSLPLLSCISFFFCPVMVTLALILQACWWEAFHKRCLCLQIHLGPLLKGCTKARRVRGAEAPDTRVHQAGPQLRAGRAESGCWRWDDFVRTFLSLGLVTCRAPSHLSHLYLQVTLRLQQMNRSPKVSAFQEGSTLQALNAWQTVN